MDSFNKLIFQFFFLFISFFYISSCNAQIWDYTSRFSARNIKELSKPTGLNSFDKMRLDTLFRGSDSKGMSVYVQKKVPISKTVVGKMFRKRAFSPNGLALLALMEGAGWIRDELTRQHFKETVETTEVGGWGTCYRNDVLWYSNTTFATCSSGNQAYTWEWCDHDFGNCYPSNAGDPIPENGTQTQTEYADAEDYANAIPGLDGTEFSDDFSSDRMKDIFIDPLTKLPNSNTDMDDNPFPETDTSPSMEEDPFRNVARFMDKWYRYSEDGLPETDPDTIPDPTTDPGFNPSPDPPTYTTSEQFDLCAAYPNILACQDLGSPDGAIPIEEETLPFDYDPVSLSGSNSCPAPYQFVLTDGNIYTLDNQPICDFAVGIKGVIIIVCSMIGMYIIAGGVRNG